jgi:GYF domain 2
MQTRNVCCPKCVWTASLIVETLGKPLRCPKCENVFTVEAAANLTDSRAAPTPSVVAPGQRHDLPTCPMCQSLLPSANVYCCPNCGYILNPSADPVVPSLAPRAESVPVAEGQRGQPLWFYVKEKKKAGPVPLAYLEGLVLLGRLQRTDMIHQQGTQKWVEAGSVRELWPDAKKSTPRFKGLPDLGSLPVLGQVPLDPTAWFGLSPDLSSDLQVISREKEEQAKRPTCTAKSWQDSWDSHSLCRCPFCGGAMREIAAVPAFRRSARHFFDDQLWTPGSPAEVVCDQCSQLHRGLNQAAKVAAGTTLQLTCYLLLEVLVIQVILILAYWLRDWALPILAAGAGPTILLGGYLGWLRRRKRKTLEVVTALETFFREEDPVRQALEDVRREHREAMAALCHTLGHILYWTGILALFGLSGVFLDFGPRAEGPIAYPALAALFLAWLGLTFVWYWLAAVERVNSIRIFSLSRLAEWISKRTFLDRLAGKMDWEEDQALRGVMLLPLLFWVVVGSLWLGLPEPVIPLAVLGVALALLTAAAIAVYQAFVLRPKNYCGYRDGPVRVLLKVAGPWALGLAATVGLVQASLRHTIANIVALVEEPAGGNSGYVLVCMALATFPIFCAVHAFRAVRYIRVDEYRGHPAPKFFYLGGNNSSDHHDEFELLPPVVFFILSGLAFLAVAAYFCNLGGAVIALGVFSAVTGLASLASAWAFASYEGYRGYDAYWDYLHEANFAVGTSWLTFLACLAIVVGSAVALFFEIGVG